MKGEIRLPFYKKSFSRNIFLVFWVVGFLLGVLFFFVLSAPGHLSVNRPSLLSIALCHLTPIVLALHFIQQGNKSSLNILLTVKGFLLGYSVCLLHKIGPLVLFSQYCCDLILLWLCIPDDVYSAANSRASHRSGIVGGFIICLIDYILFSSVL